LSSPTDPGQATPPPVLSSTDPLAVYWNRTVAELATVIVPPLTPQEKERHRVFALLTLKVVFDNFNGNCRGQYGVYPWRPKQRLSNGTYRGDQYGDRYLGHNIGCIAVDGQGKVIDFDMNHNDLFDSSVEHGESRLIRRVFSLAQRYDRLPPAEHGPAHQFNLRRAEQPDTSCPYYTILDQVTVYTSLEACAQCAGIMALAQVKQIVYLQSDPGQARISAILYNLNRGKVAAPLPIAASHFDFGYALELDQAYARYYDEVKDPDKYFFSRAGSTDAKSFDRGTSLTSFLCSDVALDIIERAAKEFESMKLAHPDYRPPTPGSGAPAVKSNKEAWEYGRRFAEYVSTAGRRGTPHRV
jgi:tRNA(Arg) A34 adenosine deaminase TadA